MVLGLMLLLPAELLHAATQQEKIRVKETTSLKSVIKQIESQTDFRFSYKGNLLDNVTVKVSDKETTVDRLLKDILANTGIAYTFSNNYIILTKNNSPKAAAKTAASAPKSRTWELKSQVIDAETKLPVIGATVFVKNTQVGTTTNVDGEFNLKYTGTENILTISYVGYATKELAMSTLPKLISLSMDNQLEEVVVVAYGTQKKASVTGALTSISPDKLVKTPVGDITNILAGQMPGVSTIQTTGQPGADQAQIFIRGAGSLSDGASSPLVLVDGVERPMSSIDPNEIENLTVLKDASSTAVFGVRGANGVVIITTKRGKVGKPTISVSTSLGLQHPISYLEQTGSYEFAHFWNMKQQNDGVTDPKLYFPREAVEAYRTGSDPIMYPNKDWSKEVFRDFFMQSKTNINMSGGSEKVKYFVSLGFFTQNGLLKKMDALDYDNNFNFNRYNFRANLDFKLSPSTNMKFNVGGNVGDTREPRPVEGIENPWVYTKIWVTPLSSPGLINGLRTYIPGTMVPNSEVVSRTGYDAFYGTGYNRTVKTTLTLDVDITQDLSMLTKGLSISARGSFDTNMNMVKEHKQNGIEKQMVYYKTHLENPNIPTTDPDYDKTHIFIPRGSYSPMTYSSSTGKDRNWYMEFRLNYNRTFAEDHEVSALVLYNQSRDYYPKSYSYIPRSYVGVVGRVTYGYKHKYLFDINAGYNGSENFAPGSTRFGLFPSASLAWVISEEGFMKNQSAITFLKLRASIGKVGNDRGTSRFMYMQSVWNPNNSYNFGVNNPNSLPGYTSGTPGNSDVTWETSVKSDFGLELKMFRDRLSLTGDYFYEKRTGILISPNSTPSIIATSLPNLNLGKVDNHGFEVSLGWSDYRPNGFFYGVDANVSFARNKIIYKDEVLSQYAYKNHTGGSTGRESGLYQFERLYNENDFVFDGAGNRILNPALPQPIQNVFPGDAMYADLNGDGIVDGNDTKVAGYAQRPEYTFGLNTRIGYKGFSFSMNWIGATNVDRMMQIEYRIPYTNAGARGLLKYFYENCWTPENPNGTLPRAAETSEGWNSSPSTLWLRDASYIRLKNITVGYTFNNSKFLKKIGASSLELTLTAYNLLTFSSMDFEDPETTPDNLGKYPLVKSVNLGINLKF